MILHVIVLILRILLSESVSHVDVLKAVVGKLFEVNISMINEFGNLQKIPEWLCNCSTKYQGIPLKNDVTNSLINENLSISVSIKSIFSSSTGCTHRWPTIMIFITDNKLSSLSGCKRLKLWNLLHEYLPGHVTQLRFEEDVQNLFKSLSILTQWKLNNNQQSYQTQSAIISQIGCGSIPDSIITTLKSFENVENVNRLSKVLSISIRGWLIADQHSPVMIRKRRHSKNKYTKFPEYSSIFYQQEKQQKEDWSDGKIVIEGSGQFDDNWTFPINDINKLFLNNETRDTSKKVFKYLDTSRPIVRRRLENITIFVGSEIYYKIPPQTFFDAEDGDTQQLKIKVYIRSNESKVDQQIRLNSTQWIYFLQKQQAIGLQPRKKNVGFYDITVCAYDSDMNRICDGIKLFVKTPKSIKRKPVYITAPPGVVWKYRIHENWVNDIKLTVNDSVIIRVQSSSLIEWQQNISTINLITEAYISKEHQIKMIAESQMTGRKMVWFIIVTISGLNTYTDATSSELFIKLSSLSVKRIPFNYINMLKEKIIGSISRYWTLLESSSREILLYRIVKGKDSFFMNSKEATAILSFVYSPKTLNSINCTDVEFPEELVENIRNDLKKNSKPFNIDLVNITETVGKCINNIIVHPKFYKTSPTPHFISSIPRVISIPDLLNKTINFEVKSGFTFKKIFLFSYQIGFKEISSIQLLDNNNLVIEESSWISLSISQFAIFGLPLLENVRQQPYLFKLKVTLHSGSTQVVIVSIVVEKFVPNFNHKFGLIISISEKDTLELARTRQQNNGNPLKTMSQLLVSQTISYRWQVVQTIARYLYADQCVSDCGTNIFIHSFSESKSWQVNISWSVVFNVPDTPDYPTIYSIASCSDEKLKGHIRSLILSDQFTESIISMFSSSIYTFEAHPHHNLIKSFKRNHLGTPTWIKVESSGSCSSSSGKTEIDSSGVVLWSNISVHQGSIFAIILEIKEFSNIQDSQTVQNSKIYFQNGSECELDWVKLSQNGRIIYGLPLLSDLKIQSYFSLQILLELGESRDKLKYYLSISIKPSRHLTRSTHTVNTTILLQTNSANYFNELDYKIKIARQINAYLHPSCTLGNKTFNLGFKMFEIEPHKRKHFEFCEKAEDVILHSLYKRQLDKKVFVDILWSQVSIWSTETNSESICNIDALNDLSGNLFQNQTTQEINQEFISYFENSGIGQIIRVQLALFGECLEKVIKDDIKIPYKTVPNGEYKKSTITSQASTKIAVGIIFFILILIGVICTGVYFLKKGIPTSFSRLSEKTNKSVALEDFNSNPKSPLKSPVSSFIKKPKNNSALDSFGPSLSNNSPKTPLLSQFSKDESKSDKQKEPVFRDEEAIGSYSYAACHPKSPEPEISPNNSIGISKQPATSNVIRNPAMMMGSRLNPYRNIPPPII